MDHRKHSAAGISKLPSELIGQIFAHLDKTDMLNARAACRRFDKGSLGHFGKRYFRKIGFMITSPSLDVLQQIAYHHDLRKYVQHVWFNPDCYTGVKLKQKIIQPDHPRHVRHNDPHDLMEEHYRAYESCVIDHRYLFCTEALQRRLHQAFSNLPNLMTVGMRRSENYVPYGSRTLERKVGVDPRFLGPSSLIAGSMLSDTTKLFAAILQALEHTSVRLQRLYTDAIEIDRLGPSFLTKQTLRTACQSVIYLELNVFRMPARRTTQQGIATSADNMADWGCGLVSLLEAMPNLTEIGLQVFANYEQHHFMSPAPGDLSTWRQSYPFRAFANLTQSVSLRHLQRIKLEKLTTTSRDLWNLIQPSAHALRSLKLRGIRLLSSADEARPWQAVFSHFAAWCPELSYLLLYQLMHDRGGISFVEHEPEAALSDADDVLLHPLPWSHGNRPGFMKYEHIAIEAAGREEVHSKLSEVVLRHWYKKPLFSYAMDEETWYTDTSDEEW